MTRNSVWCCSKSWQFWLQICRSYNHFVESFFSILGKVVAGHPVKVIFICLIVMGALASGFASMETESRSEKLYIPQNSESIYNLKKAQEYGLYHPTRLTEVIIISKKGNNILTKECFQDALSLHNRITNITGYTKSCRQMAKRTVASNSDCLTREPLGIFDYTSNNFENILVKLNEEETTKGIRFDNVLGHVTRDSLGRIAFAQAIRLVYLMKGAALDGYISKETLNWEKEFLNRMKESNDRKCGSIFYNTGRSLEDAMNETTVADVKLITLTFVIMTSFACLMLGKYRNPLTGHGLLATCGVLCVTFGIIGAFGLAMLCKVPFINIVGILPFLIVGVGIDDMFIIVDELDRSHPNQTIPTRVSKVMRRVGPAITMTTMTDLVAFAVGTTSKFPSIVYFCTYAALTISFAFIFLVTIFVAFMAYDCKRMSAGRRDMVPCLKVRTPPDGNQRWEETLPLTSNKVMEFWAKILMKPTVKGFVVVLSISLLGVGVYGSTFINEEFDRRDLAKDDSEFVKFLDASEKYFMDDIQIDLVIGPGVDYSDPLTKQKLSGLSRIIKCNQYYRAKVVSWFDEFDKWAGKDISTNAKFIDSLQRFLRTFPRFRSDVTLSNDNKTIQASRLYCFMKQTRSSVAIAKAMASLRRDIAAKSTLPAFPSSHAFIYVEQFLLILPETLRNLGCAAAAILVITTFFLVNPLVVLLVLISFISLIFELLGLMYVWGVSLNSISMINLVMAIGFAVDYIAHVAHFFVFSAENTPEGKVIDSLRTVGASVFMGGFSTFLGMVVTGFASAEIFRIFFKMFFGIVVLGLLHGLYFLPVWLALICRHNVDVNFKNENQSATQDLSAEDKMDPLMEIRNDKEDKIKNDKYARNDESVGDEDLNDQLV